MLLKSKSGENAYFQVFIEPKGEHLKGEDNDGWKERFLLEISKRYGIDKPFRKESENFVLYGLPFFNNSDMEMCMNFKKSFEDFLKIVMKETSYECDKFKLFVADSNN